MLTGSDGTGRFTRTAALSAALLALLSPACSDEGKKSDIGGSCANNTNCADSICHAGICVSRNPLTNGSPCSGAAWCRSLKCSGGTCVQNDRADGAACLHAEECASLACTAGLCLTRTRPDAGPDATVGQDNDAASEGDLTTDLMGGPDRSIVEPGQDADTPQADALPWRSDATATTCAAAVIGKACTSTSPCAAGTCLITDAANNRGVCTCSCTPDDPQTQLVNEDTCPDHAKFTCGNTGIIGGAAQSYCFEKCSPTLGSNTCDGKLVCSPHSQGVTVGANDTVCMFYGCATDSDCPVRTSTLCDTAKPSTCAPGETCAIIIDGLTAGHCAKAGTCDLLSGLCKAHTLGKATAKVGDPCKDDTECGNAMRCEMELDQAAYLKKAGAACTFPTQCCSGACQGGFCTSGPCTVINRNGSCTIWGCAAASTLTIRACPSGSTCNLIWIGGVCQKTCSLTTAAECRNHSKDQYGDYECRAWNRLAIGYGTQVSSSPVCDTGTGTTCAWLTGLGCGAVGDATNSTNMACRGLDSKILSNPADPLGFCLDTTTSGPIPP